MTKLSLIKPPLPKVNDDGELPNLDDKEPSTASVVSEFKQQRAKNSQELGTPEQIPPAPKQNRYFHHQLLQQHNFLDYRFYL